MNFVFTRGLHQDPESPSQPYTHIEYWSSKADAGFANKENSMLVCVHRDSTLTVQRKKQQVKPVTYHAVIAIVLRPFFDKETLATRS
jgi:hypothetical protein